MQPLSIAYFLIGIAAIVRVLSFTFDYTFFPPNFAPIAGMALFAGAYLGGRRAFWMPLVAMVVSDLFIGFYHWPVMVAVYASFVISVWLGKWVGQHVALGRLVAGTVASSLLFFVVTNFAVWAVPESFYPHTWSGLGQAYVMALPFLRYTLLGDFFFVGAFFGSYALASWWVRRAMLRSSVPAR